jgi:epoxide hydrolase-like predicted phosphatase
MLKRVTMTDQKIQIVFFDLGGVVLNFKGAFPKLASALGIPQGAIERAYHQHVDPAARGEIGTAEFWQRIRQDLDILHNDAVADYEDFWTDSFAPITETHELMRKLSGRLKLGIISNTEPGVFEKVLRKGHVPDLPYAVVVASCDVGCVKPNKEIYQLAQQRAGVHPGEILFVDDRLENVEAARALGWHAVLFDDTNPQRSVQEIKARLDR